MSPRLLKTVTGYLLWLASLVFIGFVLVDETERTSWFLVWLPIFVLGSVVLDYFVWNHPALVRRRKERTRRREELRNRPRYGE